MKQTHQLPQRASLKSTVERGPRSRRRGMAIVYLALCMTMFLGIAAITIDQGFHLTRKAQAQKAADAAALAGAFRLAQFDSADNAKAAAKDYAMRNGYQASEVYTEYPVTSIPDAPGNWILVRVARQERMFFGGAFTALMGRSVNSRLVGARAIALFTTLAPMNINGGGSYGAEDGPVNLSLFGPDGFYNNGDCYSVKKLADRSTNNPLYVQQPDGYGQGYNFMVNVPQNNTYLNKNIEIEIYDPDCYNAGGNVDARAGVSVDELRKPDGGTGSSANATTTRYQVWVDTGVANDPRDDTLVDTESFGNTSATDMKWNNVFTFKYKPEYYGKQLRINVTATSGSSENGFQLRAGPERVADRRGRIPDFDPDPVRNGTEITATGHLPMNFNQGGSATIQLGYVPKEAAGQKLEIRKFDTDVGGQSVIYKCDTLPGFSYTGVLSGQGEFKTDSIPVPANFQGGNWSATYTAGAGDTSVWDMAYTGAGPGAPGGIKLVQ